MFQNKTVKKHEFFGTQNIFCAWIKNKWHYGNKW